MAIKKIEKKYFSSLFSSNIKIYSYKRGSSHLGDASFLYSNQASSFFSFIRFQLQVEQQKIFDHNPNGTQSLKDHPAT
jgi:hypothetical protein